MKTNRSGSLWRILCLLLCSAVSVWAAAPVPEPTIELGEDFSLDKPVQLVMPCAKWAEVTANRDQIVADEANGTNSLKYRNTESTAGGVKPRKTFHGTVKFVGSLGVLAIISDDGCTVKVKARETGAVQTTLIEKSGKGQRLDANAFATLPFVFKRDVLYDVEVEYSQVFYTPQPGKPDIDGATLYACLLPVEFKARDLDSLNAGFDPPMAGDIHVPVDDNGNVLASEAKKDEDALEAWTSVAKSGPYATNQKTKLVVASDSIASQLELAVADDSTQWIDLQEKGKALTSKEILLTITGKDDGSNFYDSPRSKCDGEELRQW